MPADDVPTFPHVTPRALPPARLPMSTQVGLAAAMALLVAGTLALGDGAQAAAAAPPARPDGFKPSPAQWAGLRKALVQTATFHTEIDVDGSLVPSDDLITPVFSPYSGRVTQVLARPGDRVRRGDPLLSLAAGESVQGASDLAQAVAAVATARAQLTLAEASEQRQHELFLARSGAQKDWLQSRSDLAAAQGALQAAEAGLAAARGRLRILGLSDPQLAAQESAAAGAGAPESVLPAPITGTVLQRQVGPGQVVASLASGGSNPLFTLADLSTLWLLANVRESDAGLVATGQEVELRVPAWPGRVFRARVSWVAPALDPVTHRLPVRAELRNADGALRPGMLAGVRIHAGAAASAPALPAGAIVYDGESTRVWVVRADGSVASRTVRLGRANEGLVEVLDGLHAGETVVGGGALFIDRAAQGEPP